jgi:hypothetical protein
MNRRVAVSQKIVLPPQGHGLLSLRLLEGAMMWSRLSGLVVIVVSVAVLGGQPQLASDIHPESLSRLPSVQRGGLDANGQRSTSGQPLKLRGESGQFRLTASTRESLEDLCDS